MKEKNEAFPILLKNGFLLRITENQWCLPFSFENFNLVKSRTFLKAVSCLKSFKKRYI